RAGAPISRLRNRLRAAATKSRGRPSPRGFRRRRSESVAMICGAMRDHTMTSSDIEQTLKLGSVTAIGRQIRSRSVSIAEAVGWYLDRIDALNHAEPKLNAIRVVSPYAREDAEAADRELAKGIDRGP